MSAGATLSKEERLAGKTAIGHLMESGRWASTAFFKYCFLQKEGAQGSRMAVSVPKKLFKRAVKRNLLKRRVRESYRNSKALISEGSFDILFVYNCETVHSSGEILEEIQNILQSVTKKTKEGK